MILTTEKFTTDGLERRKVFVPLTGKRAITKDWQNGVGAKPRAQIGGNAGLLLEHAGLTDVDVDCPEARSIVPRFIDKRTLTIGRGGVGSHLIYAGSLTNATMKDTNGDVLLEVRHQGKQTMWTGSVHPETGEVIEVLRDVEPLPAPDMADVRAAFTSTLIARHLPASGRHDLAMYLAGYLLRRDSMTPDLVLYILRTAWNYHDAPYEAIDDLEDIVEDTHGKLQDLNEKVSGGGRLDQTIPGMTEAIREV